MGRAIGDNFFKDLSQKEGKLYMLLEAVKKDDTLCLELRENKVTIYYRGCVLYTIEEKNNGYEIIFPMGYCRKNENSIIKEQWNEHSNVEFAVKNLPYYKQEIDYSFRTSKKEEGKNQYEREYEQLILRENNNMWEISNTSDYFILDMEYVPRNESQARFDLVALKWKSTSKRNNSKNLPLALIEVKYGSGALHTEETLEKHIEDFIKFTEDKKEFDAFCCDMEKVFFQKCELGLINGNKGSHEITISREKPELILIFSNLDPDYSSRSVKSLKERLKAVIKKYPEKAEQILVAKSSEMGYGLYAYYGDRKRFPNIKEYCDEKINEYEMK